MEYYREDEHSEYDVMRVIQRTFFVKFWMWLSVKLGENDFCILYDSHNTEIDLNYWF